MYDICFPHLLSYSIYGQNLDYMSSPVKVWCLCFFILLVWAVITLLMLLISTGVFIVIFMWAGVFFFLYSINCLLLERKEVVVVVETYWIAGLIIGSKRVSCFGYCLNGCIFFFFSPRDIALSWSLKHRLISCVFAFQYDLFFLRLTFFLI